METIVAESVLPAFGFDEDIIDVNLFGTGLINYTWSVQTRRGHFILQRINNSVFSEPRKIEQNIKLITQYLKENHPDYCFAAPLVAEDGNEMIFHKDAGFFRLFPFISGSHSKDVVETADEAYEAAVQFGKFTHLLSGLDVSELKVTIPCFHDLNLRYRQFSNALLEGNRNRIRESKLIIKELLRHNYIVSDFEKIKASADFKLRVTHHDTKISNVLFDKNNKGICVIDLDTVMPGYFISDVGDMMRTYLSPVSEEETDFSKIIIREDIYKAIVEGYYQEMKGELTELEKEHFIYAGKFMIYMQALRFLTDHLNDDAYYGAKYEGHNFVRASNQLTLLERLIEKEPHLVH